MGELSFDPAKTLLIVPQLFFGFLQSRPLLLALLIFGQNLFHPGNISQKPGLLPAHFLLGASSLLLRLFQLAFLFPAFLPKPLQALDRAGLILLKLASILFLLQHRNSLSRPAKLLPLFLHLRLQALAVLPAAPGLIKLLQQLIVLPNLIDGFCQLLLPAQKAGFLFRRPLLPTANLPVNLLQKL